ncbi:hypothetical protein PR048_026840 [Dryococelus australis]|uniref:Uncharacterized protein n=1 Tax=Dryococelus australis TaxID=614101 RepID=A0ABQ9GMF3_9NEOP|nr:hypothetical protein PR048_026840 [Dryococelus australis]
MIPVGSLVHGVEQLLPVVLGVVSKVLYCLSPQRECLCDVLWRAHIATVQLDCARHYALGCAKTVNKRRARRETSGCEKQVWRLHGGERDWQSELLNWICECKTFRIMTVGLDLKGFNIVPRGYLTPMPYQVFEPRTSRSADRRHTTRLHHARLAEMAANMETEHVVKIISRKPRATVQTTHDKGHSSGHTTGCDIDITSWLGHLPFKHALTFCPRGWRAEQAVSRKPRATVQTTHDKGHSSGHTTGCDIDITSWLGHLPFKHALTFCPEVGEQSRLVYLVCRATSRLCQLSADLHCHDISRKPRATVQTTHDKGHSSGHTTGCDIDITSWLGHLPFKHALTFCPRGWRAEQAVSRKPRATVQTTHDKGHSSGHTTGCDIDITSWLGHLPFKHALTFCPRGWRAEQAVSRKPRATVQTTHDKGHSSGHTTGCDIDITSWLGHLPFKHALTFCPRGWRAEQAVSRKPRATVQTTHDKGHSSGHTTGCDIDITSWLGHLPFKHALTFCPRGWRAEQAVSRKPRATVQTTHDRGHSSGHTTGCDIDITSWLGHLPFKHALTFCPREDNAYFIRAALAQRLAYSPPTKANWVQSLAVSLHDFSCGNRAGRCRWSAGFLVDLPFPPPLNSNTPPFSPHFTLIDIQDLEPLSHCGPTWNRSSYWTTAAPLGIALATEPLQSHLRSLYPRSHCGPTKDRFIIWAPEAPLGITLPIRHLEPHLIYACVHQEECSFLTVKESALDSGVRARCQPAAMLDPGDLGLESMLEIGEVWGLMTGGSTKLRLDRASPGRLVSISSAMLDLVVPNAVRFSYALLMLKTEVLRNKNQAISIAKHYIYSNCGINMPGYSQAQEQSAADDMCVDLLSWENNRKQKRCCLQAVADYNISGYLLTDVTSCNGEGFTSTHLYADSDNTASSPQPMEVQGSNLPANRTSDLIYVCRDGKTVCTKLSYGSLPSQWKLAFQQSSSTSIYSGQLSENTSLVFLLVCPLWTLFNDLNLASNERAEMSAAVHDMSHDEQRARQQTVPTSGTVSQPTTGSCKSDCQSTPNWFRQAGLSVSPQLVTASVNVSQPQTVNCKRDCQSVLNWYIHAETSVSPQLVPPSETVSKTNSGTSKLDCQSDHNFKLQAVLTVSPQLLLPSGTVSQSTTGTSKQDCQSAHKWSLQEKLLVSSQLIPASGKLSQPTTGIYKADLSDFPQLFPASGTVSQLNTGSCKQNPQSARKWFLQAEMLVSSQLVPESGNVSLPTTGSCKRKYQTAHNLFLQVDLSVCPKLIPASGTLI